MAVTWARCGSDNHWCDLLRLNLDSVRASYGVYVIWRSDPFTGSAVVRVGQGNIAERLAVHRRDQNILHYEGLGRLLVTWAAVPSGLADQIERQLAESYSPEVGHHFPDVPPAVVNLPFPADGVP